MKAHIVHVGGFNGDGSPTGWWFDHCEGVSTYEQRADGELLMAGYTCAELRAVAAARTVEAKDV